jgi:DNA-binding NarL/FixJ family response regulator
MEMIKIILADDHHIVRKGIRALLTAQSDFQVIGETGDGLEAVSMVESLTPDVLVLDLMMGGLNGLEVTRQLQKKTPRVGIVVLSMHSDESYVLEALRSGARAYILKDNTDDDLVHAIREVARGHRYLSSPLSDRAIESYIQKSAVPDDDPYNQLTIREREILHLAAQGHNNSEIGGRLFISPRTVETHRSNLMKKLGIRSQAELIQYAVARGIIPGKL